MAPYVIASDLGQDPVPVDSPLFATAYRVVIPAGNCLWSLQAVAPAGGGRVQIGNMPPISVLELNPLRIDRDGFPCTEETTQVLISDTMASWFLVYAPRC